MKETEFEYSPSQWVPFRDKAVLERVRKIKRSEIEIHPNQNFNKLSHSQIIDQYKELLDMII